MSYKKAKDILPIDLLKEIQQYIEGETIYIPKTEENKKSWGDTTLSKEIIKKRNSEIYHKYLNGISTKKLAEEYYLERKTIQNIIRDCKKCTL